jgi:hypothetical protein
MRAREAGRCAPLPLIPAKAGIQSQGLGPRFRGDERMLHEGGAYFAGLGFELRSGAPPGLNPKLPSSSSAA